MREKREVCRTMGVREMRANSARIFQWLGGYSWEVLGKRCALIIDAIDGIVLVF